MANLVAINEDLARVMGAMRRLQMRVEEEIARESGVNVPAGNVDPKATEAASVAAAKQSVALGNTDPSTQAKAASNDNPAPSKK